jgi:uncharacterized protein (TIGR01777 family)
MEDFDAAIHLAGEPLTIGRWSSLKKERILMSRREGTRALSQTLAKLKRPPPIFLSASAIGYYGSRGEELLDEGSAPGKGFLSHVCQEWEGASRAIDSRGARVAHVRFGMVLGPSGGAFKALSRIYRLGFGGKIGTGDQWVSWVALADLIAAIDFILKEESFRGPINIVSPHPVRQKELSLALSHSLHRPAWAHLPAWLVKLVFGLDAAELLLSSARVAPKKLCGAGFHFRYPELAEALSRCND